jgi:hypothetical protein
LWCRGSHLHREYPEKTNTESKLSWCNCTLAEGEKPHPASYRCCSQCKRRTSNKKSTMNSQGILWKGVFL